MNDKIECHECGAKETHIKIRAFCGRCESHLEHYRKTRDKARDRQMALAEEVDQLRAVLRDDREYFKAILETKTKPRVMRELAWEALEIQRTRHKIDPVVLEEG